MTTEIRFQVMIQGTSGRWVMATKPQESWVQFKSPFDARAEFKTIDEALKFGSDLAAALVRLDLRVVIVDTELAKDDGRPYMMGVPAGFLAVCIPPPAFYPSQRI